MAKKTAAFDYRAKAEELERVTAGLQDPNVEIDEATKLYTAGLKLIDELEAYLNRAEAAVKKHTAEAE